MKVIVSLAIVAVLMFALGHPFELIGMVFGVAGGLFGAIVSLVVGIGGALFGVMVGLFGALFGLSISVLVLGMPLILLGLAVYGLVKLASA